MVKPPRSEVHDNPRGPILTGAALPRSGGWQCRVIAGSASSPGPAAAENLIYPA